MTELFARLAPGADLDAARAELRATYGAILTENPEAYPTKSNFRIDAKLLRDQLTSPARTVLLLLLASSGLIFVIACSNVANLILARSVRREGELAIRAALGATAGALRRTLLAESLLLCGLGAILGVIVALGMVPILGRYASRFSVRAVDLTVDASVLWVGVGLALAAAVLLAFVPRLPSPGAAGGLGLSNGSVRITPGTNRRLRLFAVMQIAASFVLLAGAGMLLTTLIALQRAPTGFETRQVLAVDVPTISYGQTDDQTGAFYREVMRQIEELPGVNRVSLGSSVPWRDARQSFSFQFSVEGYARADGEEDPRGRIRTVSPGFFASLGVPIIAGRDFNESDRPDGEKVVIVSQSAAQRMFPSVDAAEHERVKSIGCEHLGAYVLQRCRPFDRLVRRHLANDARDRRHQPVRIFHLRVHEQPPAVPKLAGRVIDRRCRPGHDVLVVNVRGHAHDPPRLTADTAELL
jgi:putative ABC transport system permease protein